MVNVTVETNEFVASVKQFMTPFKKKNANQNMIQSVKHNTR